MLLRVFSWLVVLALVNNNLLSAIPLVCQFDGASYYPIDQVYSCFTTIANDPEVQSTTTTSLIKAAQLYTFLDIAQDPPSNAFVIDPVFLVDSLLAIQKNEYKFDWDLQRDIAAAFNALRDGHTVYNFPVCYSNFDFWQPFSLLHSVDSEARVHVSPHFHSGIADYYQSQYGIDLSLYANATVININGIDVETFMQNWAIEVGTVKDLDVRFNEAFTEQKPDPDGTSFIAGSFQYRYNRVPIPDPSDSVTYTLLLTNGLIDKVTMPWVVYALKSYSGEKSFKEDYSAPDPTTLNEFRQVVQGFEMRQENDWKLKWKAAAEKFGLELRGFPELWKRFTDSYPASPKLDDSISYKILGSTNGVQVWEVFDGTDEGVVVFIESFEPNDRIEWERVISNGVHTAYDNGVRKLIIDVTANGGGDICLQRATTSFFFPGTWPNYFDEDLSGSDLSYGLTESAAENGVSGTLWSADQYENVEDIRYELNDTSWMIPGIEHDYCDTCMRNFSQLVHLTEEICNETGYLFRGEPSPYTPDQMLSLSKGDCKSSCALFVLHSIQFNSVKSLFVGGRPGSELRSASVVTTVGGTVAESDSLYYELAELGYNVTYDPNPDPSEPQPRELSTSASYRFCVREVYPRPNFDTSENGIPLEFDYIPSTFRWNYTDSTVLNPEELWGLSLPLINS